MTALDEPVTRRELDLALKYEEEREDAHRAAHDAEHSTHAEKHVSESKAVTTALDAVNRERMIHATAHEHEHESHQREHGSERLAIDKAEQSNDKRFDAVNATRSQMADILRTLASKDTVDAMVTDATRRWEENRKELDRRFDEQRLAITNIEKGDVKGEGKEIGRSAMVAIIIGSTGFIATILGIVIILANVATGTP